MLLLAWGILSSFAFARHIEPDEDGEYRIAEKFGRDELNFTILGDFGGFPRPFYNTPIQKNCAKQLNKISDEIDSQFNLAIGDNFYIWGVNSTDSKRWKKTIEDVYTSNALTSKPWYVNFGNHDWQGRPEAQMEFGEIRERWVVPKHYYRVTYELLLTKSKTRHLIFK